MSSTCPIRQEEGSKTYGTGASKLPLNEFPSTCDLGPPCSCKLLKQKLLFVTYRQVQVSLYFRWTGTVEKPCPFVQVSVEFFAYSTPAPNSSIGATDTVSRLAGRS